MNKIVVILASFILCSLAAFAHPGVGIVMDSKSNVFYTDLKHIWKINKQGKLTIAVRNVHSHELYLDENDNLFGEHLWYEGEASNKWGHYLWRLSSAGVFEKVIPPTEGFPESYSFVRDDHDHMYRAEGKEPCQHLNRIDQNKKTERFSDDCFQDIRWMTSSLKGNIYLIDHFDLKKIDSNGEVETLAINLNERKLTQFMVNDPHLLMGVWTDKNENAYVAVYGGRMVKKISPDKKVTVVAETSIGWSPTGGLVAPNGDYWLLECSPANSVRVEKITKDGKRIIYSSTE